MIRKPGARNPCATRADEDTEFVCAQIIHQLHHRPINQLSIQSIKARMFCRAEPFGGACFKFVPVSPAADWINMPTSSGIFSLAVYTDSHSISRSYAAIRLLRSQRWIALGFSARKSSAPGIARRAVARTTTCRRCQGSDALCWWDN